MDHAEIDHEGSCAAAVDPLEIAWDECAATYYSPLEIDSIPEIVAASYPVATFPEMAASLATSPAYPFVAVAWETVALGMAFRFHSCTQVAGHTAEAELHLHHMHCLNRNLRS